MSGTLPTLFRRAVDYQRQLTFTPKGVVAVETSGDPDLTRVIRAHALEVTGFVNEGMNRPGVSGHFTSFESESERHVIIEAVKQLSARVA